jgi:hypothetical protein
VLGKVYEDMLALFQAGLLTKEKCDRWRDDLLYIIDNRTMSYFQFQLKKSDGSEIGGLHYEQSSTGTITTDDKTGGIDYWNLPEHSKVNLLVSLNTSAAKYNEVNEELNRRGWGTGSALTGTQEYLKSYSKDGFGFKQSKIGQW